MHDILRLLFFETWWSWSRSPNETYLWTEIASRYFNFVEAAAWFIFAGLVSRRWHRHHKSLLELWYVFAFVLFGVSDLIEAWILTSWLLWWKGINLMVLFLLRRIIMRRFYPDARIY